MYVRFYWISAETIFFPTIHRITWINESWKTWYFKTFVQMPFSYETSTSINMIFSLLLSLWIVSPDIPTHLSSLNLIIKHSMYRSKFDKDHTDDVLDILLFSNCYRLFDRLTLFSIYSRYKASSLLNQTSDVSTFLSINNIFN